MVIYLSLIILTLFCVCDCHNKIPTKLVQSKQVVRIIRNFQRMFKENNLSLFLSLSLSEISISVRLDITFCMFCVWCLNSGTHDTVHISVIHAVCPSLLGPMCIFCDINTTFQTLCTVHISTFICVTICPSLLEPMCALFSLVLKLFATVFSVFSKISGIQTNPKSSQFIFVEFLMWRLE